MATAGTAQATVTWTVPSSSGTTAITSYLVRAVQDTSKGCAWTTGALSCVITGLTNGTSYTFTVRAGNSVGYGPVSAASNAVTPAGPPGAPTNVVATPAPGTSPSVHVAWTAPASNGGLPITDYYVTAAPGGQLCYSPPVASPSCTVQGLTAGVQYTFTVVAANAAGNGTPSAPSNPVTPVGILPGSFAIHLTGSSKPFSFAMTQAGAASTEALTMTISDVYGRTVWSRTVNPSKDGTRVLSWDARTTSGRAVSAGVYFVKITTVSGGETAGFIQKAVETR
jgi:titin